MLLLILNTKVQDINISIAFLSDANKLQLITFWRIFFLMNSDKKLEIISNDATSCL